MPKTTYSDGLEPPYLILVGDVLVRLRELPDESVHCVVTSPPYWGLRDYGVQGQIGLEPTPAEYIAKMTAVFREVRRVLRADGTCWLNMGDGYSSAPGQRKAGDGDCLGFKQSTNTGSRSVGSRAPLKPKDLIGMPWRLAFALQEDGWWLRQDIIWSKPNPMPESVTDRCTKAHEYLFLLTKSSRYFYDQDAILEPCSPNTNARLSQDVAAQIGSERAHTGGKTNGNMKAVGRHLPGNKTPKGTTAYENGDERHRTKAGLVDYAVRQRKLAQAGSGIKSNTSFDAALCLQPEKRNKRSVWEIATQPFAEAHFATFPMKLVEPCIRAGCPRGGVVLDPFNGSGTTGLVAIAERCSYIGIELNPEYAAMSERRLLAATAQGVMSFA